MCGLYASAVFIEYSPRALISARASVSADNGQWSMRHHDKCVRFGTRSDGLAVHCPMIRLYPGQAQAASSEWVFFNPGKRQPVKYTWHRTMAPSLQAVFSEPRDELLKCFVFVPYSNSEDVMDLFLWHNDEWYLIHFTNSLTHTPSAERMLEIIRSMNGVTPAALDARDTTISDDWLIPNLVHAVPSQVVGRFTFQPFQCKTSMLMRDQRAELVATLTAKVKQFKIGVQLTTAAGAQPKADYDAATSPAVLVPLDDISRRLCRNPSDALDNKVRQLLRLLYAVESARIERLMEWLKATDPNDMRESMRPSAVATTAPDGDVEMKGHGDEAEVDPLERFLGSYPAMRFLYCSIDHVTWSIEPRALTPRAAAVEPVQSRSKRPRT